MLFNADDIDRLMEACAADGGEGLSRDEATVIAHNLIALYERLTRRSASPSVAPDLETLELTQASPPEGGGLPP